jgi:hypothetical protein
MFCYSGFALTIHSELELPELSPGDGPPDVVIRRGTVPHSRRKATLTEEFAFNSVAGAFHIKEGREVVVEALPGVDPGTLRVVLLGRIMAFLLRQRGWLPLHASAVVIEGCAALFLGASGSGKSTVAAAFHRRGHLVIADDVAAVLTMEGQCVVRPASPQLRLFDDSRELLAGLELPSRFQIDKHTVGLPGGKLRQFFPVRRIFNLEYGEAVGIEAVSSLPAVSLLSTHSFVRRRKMAADVLEAHLRDCSSVVAATGVHRLVRPKSLSSLPDMVTLVERDAQSDRHEQGVRQ